MFPICDKCGWSVTNEKGKIYVENGINKIMCEECFKEECSKKTNGGAK